ncbi:MAG: pyrroline-5-carboxylate reductase [Bdellovibrionaceae bacterium]|nr:pyrroline-5-carboxylate reductase [Bdellovibrio sp.]
MNSTYKNPLLKSMKIGFVGAGHMTQALIKGMIQSKSVRADQIIVSNRTPGKLIKLSETYGVQTRDYNEQVVEECDVVVLAMKPQDMPGAIESIAGAFTEHQIIISLAAGIPFSTLTRQISDGRLVRLMPNTPSIIGRGVLGFMSQKPDDYVTATVEDLFSSLGVVMQVDTEEKFDALMISCSSGTGFVFELMMYWQDWIEEHGFSEEWARKMTVETFLGASLLAAESEGIEIEELQSRVSSKKGVTAAGLQSMREMEIERAVRFCFEKAAMRSKEISNGSK